MLSSLLCLPQFVYFHFHLTESFSLREKKLYLQQKAPSKSAVSTRVLLHLGRNVLELMQFCIGDFLRDVDSLLGIWSFFTFPISDSHFCYFLWPFPLKILISSCSLHMSFKNESCSCFCISSLAHSGELFLILPYWMCFKIMVCFEISLSWKYQQWPLCFWGINTVTFFSHLCPLECIPVTVSYWFRWGLLHCMSPRAIPVPVLAL